MDKDNVKANIAKNGFMENYEIWIHCGENDDGDIFGENIVVAKAFEQYIGDKNMFAFEPIIHDPARPSIQPTDIEDNST